MNRHHSLPLLLASSLLVATGCERKTPEERGKEYAEEKLGFAKGAAAVLKQEGKGLGSSVGTGVAELVKGAGAAVKDVAYPPIQAVARPELAAAGLAITEAHEGADGMMGRRIVLAVKATQAFEGGLRARALDEAGQEIGQALLGNPVVLAAGESRTVELDYPSDLRLSKVARHAIEIVAPKSTTVAPGLPKLALSQLREDGNRISLYVVFQQPFDGALELRALDAAGTELGRSEPLEKRKQAADTAEHVTFTFDPLTPIARAASYVVHPAKARAKK